MTADAETRAVLVGFWEEFRDAIDDATVAYICQECLDVGVVAVSLDGNDDCPDKSHPSWAPVVTRAYIRDAFTDLVMPPVRPRA